MGILSYLRGDDLREDSGKSETRSLPAPENELPLFAAFSDARVTPAAALAIADVWAAVRVLSDAASSLPLHVYRKSDAGRARVTSGKLVDLLDRPAPGMTQADLVSTMMAHLAIHGDAYVAKYREQAEVAQLGLLNPERVRPELENGQLRWRYQPGSTAQVMLTDADVVHIRGLSTDSLSGLSAVSQASRVLGLSDELVKHAVAYFEVGDRYRGVHRPAGLLKVHPDMSETGRQAFVEQLTNESRPHGMLVVEGDVDYQPVAEKLDDSQFVEQRRLAAQEIARVFRIPAHMLGAPSADSMTYSNVEQESIEFVRYSLTPWLRRIELAISGDRDLAFERQFVKFELDGLLRADAKTRAEVYAAALDPVSGWLTRAEVRELEDLPPESTPPTRQQTVEQMLARPQEVANGNGT